MKGSDLISEHNIEMITRFFFIMWETNVNHTHTHTHTYTYKTRYKHAQNSASCIAEIFSVSTDEIDDEKGEVVVGGGGVTIIAVVAVAAAAVVVVVVAVAVSVDAAIDKELILDIIVETFSLWLSARIFSLFFKCCEMSLIFDLGSI
jgi:hypothetical protein